MQRLLLNKYSTYRTGLYTLPKKVFCIKLTHIGPSKMVNVTDKTDNLRWAKAGCFVTVRSEVLDIIRNSQNAKGDVLRTAEIAGILASKKTHELIPLCHQLNLNTCNIKIELPEPNTDNKIYVEVLIFILFILSVLC